MSKLINSIEFVAEGAGRFEVYQDDTYISQHNDERKAVQKCTELKISSPESDVYYNQALRVNCSADFTEINSTDVNDTEDSSNNEESNTEENSNFVVVEGSTSEVFKFNVVK